MYRSPHESLKYSPRRGRILHRAKPGAVLDERLKLGEIHAVAAVSLGGALSSSISNRHSVPPVARLSTWCALPGATASRIVWIALHASGFSATTDAYGQLCSWSIIVPRFGLLQLGGDAGRFERRDQGPAAARPAAPRGRAEPVGRALADALEHRFDRVVAAGGADLAQHGVEHLVVPLREVAVGLGGERVLDRRLGACRGARCGRRSARRARGSRAAGGSRSARARTARRGRTPTPTAARGGRRRSSHASSRRNGRACPGLTVPRKSRDSPGFP